MLFSNNLEELRDLAGRFSFILVLGRSDTLNGGRKMRRHLLLWTSQICLLAVVVVAFQNCVNSRPSTTSASTSSKNSGQPYDGMRAFVVKTACADGTLVNSRITLTRGSYALERDNCQTIGNRPLDASAFQTSGDSILYQGKKFDPEALTIIAPEDRLYEQFQGTLLVNTARVNVLDLFEYAPSDIQTLKTAGHLVFCYISAGLYEGYRPDAAAFQAKDIGKSVAKNQNYVDIRSANIRAIMLARIDVAKSRGCDGIDFDNVDNYANSTGFPLTSSDQIDYNSFLALGAHDRGMLVSQENLGTLAASSLGYLDMTIATECFKYSECSMYQSVAASGKPVFNIEFSGYSALKCSQASSFGFGLSFLSPKFDGSYYQQCQ
jgi:hypothetical protein